MCISKILFASIKYSINVLCNHKSSQCLNVLTLQILLSLTIGTCMILCNQHLEKLFTMYMYTLYRCTYINQLKCTCTCK